MEYSSTEATLTQEEAQELENKVAIYHKKKVRIINMAPNLLGEWYVMKTEVIKAKDKWGVKVLLQRVSDHQNTASINGEEFLRNAEFI